MLLPDFVRELAARRPQAPSRPLPKISNLASEKFVLQPAANLTGAALAVFAGQDTLDAVARRVRPAEQLLQDARAGIQSEL